MSAAYVKEGKNTMAQSHAGLIKVNRDAYFAPLNLFPGFSPTGQREVSRDDVRRRKTSVIHVALSRPLRSFCFSSPRKGPQNGPWCQRNHLSYQRPFLLTSICHVVPQTASVCLSLIRPSSTISRVIQLASVFLPGTKCTA